MILLVHSWDKKEMFDAVTADHGLLSDTFTSPNQPEVEASGVRPVNSTASLVHA